MSAAPEPGAGITALEGLLAGVSGERVKTAFTHASWVESRRDSYGPLAFLGDSVLRLAVAEHLFDELPEADIGELTKVLNQAVSGRACAEVALELQVPARLAEHAPSDGSGISVSELTASERPLASVLEAVLGACFLTHGYEPTVAAVCEAFADQIEFARSERVDFKSELQERLARHGGSVTYEVVAEDGPPHDRRFEVEALVDGGTAGSGAGRSKKEAEQAAAEQAIDGLEA